MEKVLSFVNIYRNVGEDKKVKYNATVSIGDVMASSNKIPPFNAALFVQRVTKNTGVKYMGSKFPLLVTHSGVTVGDKPGVYFTDILAIEEPPRASEVSLAKLFGEETADAPKEEAADAPKEEAADAPKEEAADAPKEEAADAPQETADAPKADEF